MRVDQTIKYMAWPEPYKGDKQDFRITLSWPVINQEKLLVATIQKNEKKRRWHEPTPDFRLICSKEKNAAAILYQGERISKRKGLDMALWGIGCVSVTSCYPKISREDEKALAEWLGLKAKQTRNHCIPELSEWTAGAIAAETQRERDARGELRDEDVLLCPEALPDGLVEYIRRSVLPNDDVLIYKKGNVRGTCFQCRQNVRATGGQRFRQGEFATCPNCGRRGIAYLDGSDRFKVDYVEDIVTIQKGTDGKTVFLRQWHLLRDKTAQWNDIPAQLEEICRYAIRGNRVAKWQHENKENRIYGAFRYRLSEWTRTQSVSVVYDGQYYFYLPENWREHIAGTSLQYCDLADYNLRAINAMRDRNMIRFLLDWARYPAIEKFWKAGYTTIVHERIRGLNKETQHTMRWTRNSIHEAIRFPSRFLKLHDSFDWTMGDMQKVTKLWKQVESGELRENDLPEMARSLATLDDIRDAMGHASIHRILRYVDSCVEKEREQRRIEAEEARREGRHYWSDGPLQAPHTYRDYLKDCVKLNLDLDDKTVLFPRDLDAAHARTIAQVKHQANEKSREAFRKEVQRLKWMEWEKDGLLIRLPVDGDEITAEGAYLHHCVGGYVDRMANGKTTIFFVRRVEEPDKPFYTLEWLNGQVQQCRTTCNGNYIQNPEIKCFVDAWVEKISKKGSKKKTAIEAA